VKKIFIAVCIASLSPIFAHASASAEVVKQASTVLGKLGAQPSGTTQQDKYQYCIFNEWKIRDKLAAKNNKSDSRFSIPTKFGGKWYCYQK
jgi:hypothetical protein